MARLDAIVLGAGIVGTSIALHLVKRGMSVALIDRGAPGRGTSYGTTGVIETGAPLPLPFPRSFSVLMRLAFKRAPEANYHLASLPKLAPWLFAYRANSTPERRMECALLMRPLFEHALSEHETLMDEAGATRYLRKGGRLNLYRSDRAFAATARERELAAGLDLACRVLDSDAARAIEPALAPVFRYAVHWQGVANVNDPLAVTQAYAARFTVLGGRTLTGDARTLRRAGDRWSVATEEGHLEADQVVVALGPWAPDLMAQFGIRPALGVMRGYHRQFRLRGKAGLGRPVMDMEIGYGLAPMEQGIRLTTGAEFAARDARPTPVQFDRLMPMAKDLFPLGEPIETTPWMGSRLYFADSRPAIGRAPGQPGMWLAFGHAHWGARARACHWQAGCRDDDGQDAFLRSDTLCSRAVCMNWLGLAPAKSGGGRQTPKIGRSRTWAEISG